MQGDGSYLISCFVNRGSSVSELQIDPVNMDKSAAVALSFTPNNVAMIFTERRK